MISLARSERAKHTSPELNQEAGPYVPPFFLKGQTMEITTNYSQDFQSADAKKLPLLSHLRRAG